MARLNESDAWRVLGPQSGDDGHWTARLRCLLVDSGGVVFPTANKRQTRCFRVCGKQIFGGISDFTLTISSIVETCWNHQPVQFGHEQRIFCWDVRLPMEICCGTISIDLPVCFIFNCLHSPANTDRWTNIVLQLFSTISSNIHKHTIIYHPLTNDIQWLCCIYVHFTMLGFPWKHIIPELGACQNGDWAGCGEWPRPSTNNGIGGWQYIYIRIVMYTVNSYI